jgi:hypothetical protein
MRIPTILLALGLAANLGSAQSPAETPAAASGKAAQGEQTGAAFPEAAMNKVLLGLKKGMEDHVESRFLSEFDANRMDGYLEFQEQVAQFFRQFGSFRFYSRILQTSVDEEKGVALVELQIEAAPRQESGTALRRDKQIRFELEHGKAGWKIVDFQPRDLLAP